MDGNFLREYYILIRNKILDTRFEAAIASADKLLSAYPRDEWGYYYKGVCFFALEKYKESVRNYTIALQLNPGLAKAYFNLGVCFYIVRKYDLALINIAKAMIIFTKQKELEKEQRCVDALKVIQIERGD